MTKTYLLMVISEESVCLTSSLTPLTADLAGTVCKVSHSSIADERPQNHYQDVPAWGRLHRSISITDSFFRKLSNEIYLTIGSVQASVRCVKESCSVRIDLAFYPP